MPTPPLPASPCVRARLDYTHDSGLKAGSRFYLSYTGSPPTPGNCGTLATDIADQWASDLEGEVNTNWALTEVDVLDIATDSGASGQWTGTFTGLNAGTPLAAQVAMNIEYGIARRYRGGKPRMYLPPGVTGNTDSDTTWSSAFLTSVQTAVAAFFAGIEALTVGSMGTLAHVNLSYYKGFTNFTQPSGREKAVPKYRDTALLDTIESYSPKKVMGSQKRRRTSTSF